MIAADGLDRCWVCNTSVSLYHDAEACPGGHVLTCEGCSWRDACPECEIDYETARANVASIRAMFDPDHGELREREQ